MEQPKVLSDFVKAKDLCEFLGITRSVLLAWVNRGLPYVRVGSQLLFREASVAEWLVKQEKVREEL
jgi:excisionase family DNA binding protein